MLTILIVEDDDNKRDAIVGAIAQVAELPADTTVSRVTTASQARNALSSKRFDVVVLDIALPRNDDSDIDPFAGVGLLDDLVERPNKYYVPTHIIGLTGFPEIVEATRGRFASILLTLTLYDSARTDWSDALKARLRHILSAVDATADVALSPGSDVNVICALQLELNAILGLPWEWKQVGVRGDHAIYWRGTYGASGEERSVYAGLAARMGMPAAASVASKMIHAFKPRFVGIVGIAAGVRNRVSLGDVVAADPSWDWGSGKWHLEEHEPTFAAAPYQIPSSPWVRERLRLIAADTRWLDTVVEQWPGTRLTERVRMHVGPMASGAAVLADSATAERIVQQNRQLLAIEMEAYGVFAAAEESSEPRPQAFAIKSIVDFADGRKNDRFQSFGAYVAAQTFRYFAESHL
jgi:nucleoside phosphorylase/CheY-like chemotaxis protein